MNNTVRQFWYSVLPWSSHSLTSTYCCRQRRVDIIRLDRAAHQQHRTMVDFASTRYQLAFQNLPQPDHDALRQSTLHYLASLDPHGWYDDPMTSLLLGQKCQGGSASITTTDALGRPNGAQYFSTSEQLNAIKNHICTFQSPHRDLRLVIRAVEDQLLTTFAGELIGNQCVDFQKQDGITEMEEAIMANTIERRLNDVLLEDEKAGILTIHRRPIFVSCVSNFTNFLDLFRKTIRSLEVGIPCVILGRCNNAQQHSYRWAVRLMELLLACQSKNETCHPGMLTFVSGSLNDIQDVTQSCQDHTGNLYATCSRSLAREIRNSYRNIVASTGGPNTLVTTKWTESVCDAIRMSATIESSGQCTALRHCVIPSNVTSHEIENMINQVTILSDAQEAVQKGIFDGIFAWHHGSTPPGKHDGYVHHKNQDVYFRVDEKLPQDHHIPEYWRKVVVDFSRLDVVHHMEQHIGSLAAWLNRHQPISLAVNEPRSQNFELGRHLFETTGLVVYTLGSTDPEEAPPALTCQAQPQDGEIFGEFPPRTEMDQYTRFPVIVPSSTPSYDVQYTHYYLNTYQSRNILGQSIENLIRCIENETIRGYCNLLLDYIWDATNENPKLGFGKKRTTLWGLQRPALGLKTCIRCHAENIWDDIAPTFLIFYATNARQQIELSLDPECQNIASICRQFGIDYKLEPEDAFSEKSGAYSNIVRPSGSISAFPMVGLFVSLHLPLGHIKSTKPADNDFVRVIRASAKWLKPER